MRENRVFIRCLLVALLFVVLIVLFSGCGLSWTPLGGTPPPGSKPIGDVILDAGAKLDQAGWGDLAQVLGGALGCGGIVAVTRRTLRKRAKCQQERNNAERFMAQSARQKTALQEIVAGVQEIMEKDPTGGYKPILKKHQKHPETRQLVQDLKTALKAEADDAAVQDKN